MTIKGFPSSQKLPLGTGITNEFATVVPTDEYRNSLDINRPLFRVTTIKTAAASTGNVDGVTWVYDTSTLAKKGDVVRFETGNAQYIEIPIVKVETNRFLLGAYLASAPASGDTFYILRSVSPRVDATGTASVTATSSPIQFNKNAVATEVSQDIVTPANSNPLPVSVLYNSPDVLSSGTITTSSNIVLSTVGLNAFAFQVTGTWVGTIVVEGTVDGTTYIPTTYVALASGNTSASFTANTIGQGNCAGLISVRLRGATLASGSAVISFRGTVGLSTIMLDNPLPAGSNTIGAVSQSGTWNIGTVATITNPVAVTGTFFQATQPVSGSVSVSNFPATQPVSGSVSVSNFPATQPVSGTVAVSTLFALDTTLTTTNTEIGALTETAPATDTASSGLNGRLQRVAQRLTSLIGLLPTSIGQKANAGSLSVALASDTTIPATLGRAKVAQLFNDYSVTSVTTAAYVQLTASTAAVTNKLEIFDSSGEVMILAVGAAASEVDQLYIFPGGNGPVDLTIASGSRISIKAKTATASVGLIAVNLYS